MRSRVLHRRLLNRNSGGRHQISWPNGTVHLARANDVVMAYFRTTRAVVQPMVPRHCLSGDTDNHHGKRWTKSTARRA